MSATGVETELWGEETSKAVANFPVSGEPIPVPVIRWLGRIKAAAARVNAELGLLDAEIAERIADAGDEVAAGKHDDQFPIDVFQTGSGTSSNMNANEVMANLAGDDTHPNDHVNMGQSSNDVFPSAVHLAALGEVTHDLLPAMDGLASALERKCRGVRRRGQGRPHAPDGRGAGDPRPGVRWLRRADQARARPCAGTLGRVGQIPLGGTATGTGLNTHSEFAEQGPQEARRGDRPRDLRAARPIRGPGQPRRPGRALRGPQGRRRIAHQDRQRPGADGIGSARRAGRDPPAGPPEGLLDHARQGQPGDLRGGDPGGRRR